MNNSHLISSLLHKHSAVISLLGIVLPSVLSGFQTADAATTTATVEVNIVSTINLVAQNGIVFGDISASEIPGTVTIGTDSSRVTAGGVTVNTNTSATPAQYEVSGDPNAFYHVTLPDSVVLTSAAGDSMVVDKFTSIPDADGQLDSAGRQNMNIGATLNVDSFQPFGAYRGTMSTTVDYD